MDRVSIGAARLVDQVKERLDYEFRFLQEEGVDIDVHETNWGNLTFIGCDVRKKDRKKSGWSSEDINLLLRHYIANAVSDVIVNDWEEFLIRKIIRQNYYYFTREEQEQIYQAVQKNLDGRERDLLRKINRKSKIIGKIIDYLDRNNELVIDGFITFRLKEYLTELEEAVDHSVDEFVMEKEYNEFIRLLRYFIDTQESKIDETNVFLSARGSFTITDEKFNPIKDEYIDEFIIDVMDGDLEYEDLLVSALISLAPKKITIHFPHAQNKTDWESLNTIKNVFGDRVFVCPGCTRCKPGPEPEVPE